MRKISVLFEIPEDDFYEYKFELQLKNNFDHLIKDYKVLIDTKEMYDNDDNFKKLVKAEKKARKIKEDYLYKKLNA